MDFNFQPIVQQYTPAPVQEFDAFGQVLQDRYQTNMANWDALDTLSAQLEVQQGAEHIKDNAVKDIRALMEEYQKNGNYEDAAPKLRLAAKRLANDRQLKLAQENYLNAKKWDEAMNEVTARGGRILQFKDYRTARFDDKGNIMSNSGAFGNEQYLDPTDAYASLTDQIAPEVTGDSSSDWGRFTRGLYEQVQNSAQVQQITEERIRGAVQNNIDRLIATNDSVNQRFRDLTQLQGLDEAQAKDIITNEAVAVGSERVFRNVQTSSSRSPMANPYTADAIQNEQLKAARQNNFIRSLEAKRLQQEAAGVQYNPLQSISEVVKTETDALGSNLGIKDMISKIGSADAHESSQHYQAFKNNISRMAIEGTGKVKEQAQAFNKFLSALERAFPNSYRQTLAAMDSGFEEDTARRIISRSGDVGKAIERTDIEPLKNLYQTNPKQAEHIMKSFVATYEYARGSKDFFGVREKEGRDFILGGTSSELEKEYKKQANTYEIDWLRPSELLMSSSQSSAWNKWTNGENNNASDYTLVSGDKEGFKGDMRLHSYSGGNAEGKGILVELLDKDGNVFLAKPKSADKINLLSDFVQDEGLKWYNLMKTSPESVYLAAAQNPNDLETLGKIARYAVKAAGPRGVELENKLFQPREGSGTLINLDVLRTLINEVNYR